MEKISPIGAELRPKIGRRAGESQPEYFVAAGRAYGWLSSVPARAYVYFGSTVLLGPQFTPGAVAHYDVLLAVATV